MFIYFWDTCDWQVMLKSGWKIPWMFHANDLLCDSISTNYK